LITRKVIITAKQNLESSEKAFASDHVRKLWLLPRNQVLLEFYHPSFEMTRNPRIAGLWDDSSRQAAADAVQKEKALLGPLYRRLRTPSDALMLLIPSRTAIYEFVGFGKGKIALPQAGCSSGWESVKEIRIAGKLSHRSEAFEKRKAAFETVIDEWSGALKELGVEVNVNCSPFVGTYFSRMAQFSEPCGDACMALFMLATITRPTTDVECLGFFHEGDFETPFLEIGGPGRTEQVRLNP